MDINQTSTDVVAAAIATHGRPTWIAHVPERIRAEVPKDIIAGLLAGVPLDLPLERRVARVVAWCSDHLFEEVTPAIIAEIGDIAPDTARRFMVDHPDRFRRMSRTTFEIRDPETDRANGKRKLAPQTIR